MIEAQPGAICQAEPELIKEDLDPLRKGEPPVGPAVGVEADEQASVETATSLRPTMPRAPASRYRTRLFTSTALSTAE